MKDAFFKVIIIICILTHPFYCFAADKEYVENQLNMLGAKEIKESSLDDTHKIKNKDVGEETITDSLYRFDVSQDGMIAVIYSEYNQTLVIYDTDMNETHRYKVWNVNGIMFEEKDILLFWKDKKCGLYDVEGDLLAAYELTEADITSETYDMIRFNNERSVGSQKYYLTGAFNRKPRSFNYHTEYNCLVKENERGEKTILLGKDNSITIVIILIPCILAIVIIGIALAREQLLNNKNKKR